MLARIGLGRMGLIGKLNDKSLKSFTLPIHIMKAIQHAFLFVVILLCLPSLAFAKSKTTQLEPQYCNQEVAIDQTIAAEPVQGASSYRFVIVNQTLGFNHQEVTSSEILDLGIVPGLQIGVDYEVTVYVFSGNSWSAAGTVCTISLLVGDLTELEKAYCDAEVAFDGLIKAYEVPGAMTYWFQIENNSIPYSFDAFSTSNALDLSTVPGLIAGENYTVLVQYQDGAGAWSGFGGLCTIDVALPFNPCYTDACNLICNGGFENSPDNCSGGFPYGQIDMATCPSPVSNWCATYESPNWCIRNSCDPDYGVPNNSAAGSSGPGVDTWNGQGAGNDAYGSMGVGGFFEGLYTTSSEPLHPGSTYKMSLWAYTTEGSAGSQTPGKLLVSFHNQLPVNTTGQQTGSTWYVDTESAVAKPTEVPVGAWTKLEWEFVAPCIDGLSYVIIEPEPDVAAGIRNILIDDVFLTEELAVEPMVPFCSAEIPQFLQANMSGFWSGNGISLADQGVFDPALVGSGVSEITLLNTNEYGCIKEASEWFEVQQGQPMSWPEIGLGIEDRGLGVVADTRGNYFVTGAYSGGPQDPPFLLGNNTYVTQGYSDVFLAKYSRCNGLDWVTTGGGLAHDGGVEVDYDNLGNLYVAGFFDDEISIDGLTLIASGTGQHTFLAKFAAADGTIDWLREINPTQNAFQLDGLQLVVDKVNGGGYVAGSIASAFTLDQFSYSSSNLGEYFVAKFDQSGGFVWQDHYGANVTVVGDLELDKAGNLYLNCQMSAVGVPFTINNFVGGGTESFVLPPLFVAKYDPNGVRKWGKFFESQTINHSIGLAVDRLGNVYSTATYVYWDQFEFDGTVYTIANPPYNTGSVLISLDAGGEPRWSRNLGGTFDAEAEVDDISVFVAGSTNDGSNAEDIFVTCYDCLGNAQWYIQSGSSNPIEDDNFVWDLAVDINGTPFVTGGYSQQLTLGSTTLVDPMADVEWDYYFTQVTVDPVSGPYFKDVGSPTVLNIDKNQGVVTLFPNPTTGTFTIDLEGVTFDQGQILIYSIDGKLMFSQSVLESNLITVETNLSSGLYFVELSTESGRIVEKLVVR